MTPTQPRRPLAHCDGFYGGFSIGLDGDGLNDALENGIGTNPFGADTDGDGLIDGFEVLTAGTDPLLFDTNDNDCPDGEEALKLCATCPSDLNNDGMVSVADVLFLLIQFGEVCP